MMVAHSKLYVYAVLDLWTVKPEGDQHCIFDAFLTKSVRFNENLWGVERHQRGGVNPLSRQIERCVYMSL